MRYDITVVGAGAAGLMAAIFAGRTNRAFRIALVDGAKRLGAKILISGGGRCNVTHHEVTAADFNGNRNTIARVLRTFPVSQTVDFFREIGVELKREETGKLFPVTDRARTVLDALLREAGRAGVDVLQQTRVTAIRSGFEIDTTRGMIESRRVVMATGGRSVPKTGSDGAGFDLVRALGHSVTETFPALVPLVIEEPHWIKELSGTSADVDLSLRSSTGKILHRERGSVLFAHFGISGPAVLDMSRHWIEARQRDPGAGLAMNFLPGRTFEAADEQFDLAW